MKSSSKLLEMDVEMEVYVLQYKCIWGMQEDKSKQKLFQIFLLTVGLDAAGKTTILYKLKLGDVVITIPTLGEICWPNVVKPHMQKPYKPHILAVQRTICISIFVCIYFSASFELSSRLLHCVKISFLSCVKFQKAH